MPIIFAAAFTSMVELHMGINDGLVELGCCDRHLFLAEYALNLSDEPVGEAGREAVQLGVNGMAFMHG